MFQFYFHKDEDLMTCLERAKAAKFDVMALTVDTITGEIVKGLRTGFTSPQINLIEFIWFRNKTDVGNKLLTKGKFELPHLQDFVRGTSTNSSIGNYFLQC